MSQQFDPESVDLAQVADRLRALCGPSVEGAVVGRTGLRDAVVEQLGCSQLEAETIVDTLVARGFVLERHARDGRVVWVIRERSESTAS